MASSPDKFYCLACGADDEHGLHCSRCGAPTLITANQLPDLIQRKLKAVGFEEPPASSPAASISEQAAAALTDKQEHSLLLLTFPPRFFERRATPTLDVAAIATMTAGGDYSQPVAAVLDRVHRLVKGSGKQALETVRTRVYVICPSGAARDNTPASDPAKSWSGVTESAKRPIGQANTTWKVTPILIDASAGIAHNANRHLRTDAQVLSAVAQLTLPLPPKPSSFLKSYLLNLAEKAIATVRSYGEHLSLLPDPEFLAFRIPRMLPEDVVKTLVMGIAVAALANQIFGSSIQRWTSISALNSAIDSLVVSLLVLMSAAFAWPLLRIAGGRGSFRNTFVAAALIAAAIGPAVTLIQGAATSLHLSIANYREGPAGTVFGASAIVYAPIHDLPWRRAFFALLSPFLVLYMLVDFYFRSTSPF